LLLQSGQHDLDTVLDGWSATLTLRARTANDG
jgi:hypothetical protein